MNPARLEALLGSLNALAATAALIDARSPLAASAQADAVVAWLQTSIGDIPELASQLSIAERVAEGLRRGLEPEPGVERLNSILEATFRCIGGPYPLQGTLAPMTTEALATTKSSFLELSPDEREGWSDFLVEAPELLAAIEGQLLGSLRHDAFDPMAILRPLHTLKGICGMLGLLGMNRLMHVCEDLLHPYRQAKELPNSATEVLLGAMDLLRAQIDAIAAGLDQGGFNVIDVSPMEQAMKLMVAGVESAGAGDPATVTVPAPFDPSADAITSENEPQARTTENVIRIPVAKMDTLLEAVSELAICQAQVTGGVLELNVHGPLAAEANRLEKISRQLQQVVLSLRMVPVQPLFNRISRQAYDLGRRMGKPLRVELEGGETEVDKGLVEELFEPLLHLVRNALDHGLDTPEQRQATGKAPEGCLKLAAYHQGSEFVLQMSDDGRGFDLEAIAAKARAQGRLRVGEEASADFLVDLLFQPGFSTAAQLTDLSGRGVGLDAVRRRVADLKGTVKAEAVSGKGAVFTLRLPLTMALMEAILVRTRGERYALPAANVLRFLAWDVAGRHAVGEGEAWYEAAGKSLPLVDVGAEGTGRAVAMHVSIGGRQACLVVDEVLGKQQVVIKALGGLLKEVPGIGGGAVLADGRVGLILDLDSLLKQHALA